MQQNQPLMGPLVPDPQMQSEQDAFQEMGLPGMDLQPGADFPDPYEILPPHLIRFKDKQAQGAARRGQVETFFTGPFKGLSTEEISRLKNDNDHNAVASWLAQKVGERVSPEQFNAWKDRYEQELSFAPKHPVTGQVAPLSMAQAGIAALAAVLDPRNAAADVQGVLEGNIRESQRRDQAALQNYEMDQSGHQERLKALYQAAGMEGDMLQRSDANYEKDRNFWEGVREFDVNKDLADEHFNRTLTQNKELAEGKRSQKDIDTANKVLADPKSTSAARADAMDRLESMGVRYFNPEQRAGYLHSTYYEDNQNAGTEEKKQGAALKGAQKELTTVKTAEAKINLQYVERKAQLAVQEARKKLRLTDAQTNNLINLTKIHSPDFQEKMVRLRADLHSAAQDKNAMRGLMSESVTLGRMATINSQDMKAIRAAHFGMNPSPGDEDYERFQSLKKEREDIDSRLKDIHQEMQNANSPMDMGDRGEGSVGTMGLLGLVGPHAKGPGETRAPIALTPGQIGGIPDMGGGRKRRRNKLPTVPSGWKMEGF